MKSSELNQPIVLVGMMGVGKTYLGSRLATALSVEFIDTDKIIEDAKSIPITQIFANQGESYFRNLEHHTIKNTLKGIGMVVAVGGGAYTFKRNREIIDGIGISVWLDAEPETILRRISGEGNRPLLEGGNRLLKIRALLEQRKNEYNKSMLRFQTDTDLSTEDLVCLMKEQISTFAAVKV
ncbi:MAG: shikimate kinase [Rhodobacteraceae bacterium]|nr:shikimate kinase [Paracoccaceae bacterium]MCY4250981.1 shikimate kinase [Paracoccaceae bacterium]MCY4307493.1 shikimate kinase [Paracoccaceae bacterium]